MTIITPSHETILRMIGNTVNNHAPLTDVGQTTRSKISIDIYEHLLPKISERNHSIKRTAVYAAVFNAREGWVPEIVDVRILSDDIFSYWCRLHTSASVSETAPSKGFLGKPGQQVKHDGHGTIRTLSNRKADDSGWWLEGGGGLADRVLEASDTKWKLLPDYQGRLGQEVKYIPDGTVYTLLGRKSNDSGWWLTFDNRFGLDDDVLASSPHLWELLVDWTESPDGHSNSSDRYLALVNEVARMIRSEGGAALDAHWTQSTARLIMSQLAHKHKLSPDEVEKTKSS